MAYIRDPGTRLGPIEETPGLPSDTKIRSAKPAERPYKLTDARGLYLHVTPAGSRIWRVRYEIADREQVLTIGAYPAVSLAEARAARDAAREVRRAGRNPAVERKAAQTARAADEANTFESVARAWHANMPWGPWATTGIQNALAGIERQQRRCGRSGNQPNHPPRATGQLFHHAGIHDELR